MLVSQVRYYWGYRVAGGSIWSWELLLSFPFSRSVMLYWADMGDRV